MWGGALILGTAWCTAYVVQLHNAALGTRYGAFMMPLVSAGVSVCTRGLRADTNEVSCCSTWFLEEDVLSADGIHTGISTLCPARRSSKTNRVLRLASMRQHR
jgi:hypothetical protein